MSKAAIEKNDIKKYLMLVSAYLHGEELSDYERRMSIYYFSNGIPALIAAKQIRECRDEGAAVIDRSPDK